MDPDSAFTFYKSHCIGNTEFRGKYSTAGVYDPASHGLHATLAPFDYTVLLLLHLSFFLIRRKSFDDGISR